MATNYIPQSESDHKPSTESLKSPQKKRGKFFYLLLGVGGLGLIFLLARPFSIGSSKSTSTETVARVLPVETIKVEPVESYEVLRTYTGEIAAIRTSNLGFSRGGEIEEVLVEEGDRINRGQALARLDIRNLQTQRQQLEAEKARAQAQLSELRTGARIEDINAAKAAVQDLEQQLLLQSKQRERREFLYKEGAIAREQLDEFSFGEGALQARLSQARSNLAELENGTRQEQIDAQRATVQQLLARIADLDVTIDKSTLKAPFDGIVAKRDLDEGTVANAGQSVVRLMENAAPEARIGMPTNVVGKLQVGGTQALKIGSQTYKAKVASILPEVNANTRTQTVVFQLDPSAITQVNPAYSVASTGGTPATTFPAGQTIRLELAQEIDTEGYWLPTDALTQGIRGLWTCYVLTESEDAENYIVKQHSVEIINQQGDRALVRGTLQPGDRIVANGTHRLVPGQQVEVASSE